MCKLTISTTVDGQTTMLSRLGKLEVLNGAVSLQYKEENASVSLILKENWAEIERLGDYSLHLRLHPKQVTEGSIGIGGGEGKISVYTHRVRCVQEAKEIEAELSYQLLFGKESQKMQLRLTAQTKENIYEKNDR